MGARKFRMNDGDQSLLLPPSLDEWLPEAHLARFVSETVDALDLREWERSYATETGAGAPPFHPMMLLKVEIYAYATGTFSSRKIASRCVEDVAYRYLTAQATPDFRSLLKFRKRHLERFEQLFVQVVQLAQEAGLVKLGRIALDGSKLKANASKHKAMSYGRMSGEEAKLGAEIHELVERADAVDAQEDGQFGDGDGYSLPDALAHREQRLKTIQAAKARLEERAKARAAAEAQRREEEARARVEDGRKPKKYRKAPDPTPKPKEQENFTDPESRIMKDGATKGFLQAYNAQIAVDEANQIIVATEVNNQAADNGQLVPLLEKVEATTGQAPAEVLADAGYKNEETFVALENAKTEGYIACGRESYDPRVPCPTDPLPEDATATRRMERKLLTPNGRRIYRKRKSLVEPVFGWIKNVLGFRQTSFRGQANVRAEWHLVCLAHLLQFGCGFWG